MRMEVIKVNNKTGNKTDNNNKGYSLIALIAALLIIMTACGTQSNTAIEPAAGNSFSVIESTEYVSVGDDSTVDGQISESEAASTTASEEFSTGGLYETQEKVYSSSDILAAVKAEVPEYTGSASVTVNNNVPFFNNNEITPVSYEYYSPLDSLGRCGVCIASIGTDIMPTEEYGSIGSVRPTGWHTIKYAGIVDGNYLYNRCHLIGFQLTGENANTGNLITGTRYLNIQGMLPYENMVADYVKKTNNHVMYRVTPVFDGDNLVCDGVLMEALSVEDNGKGIKFNVFCYNVQPGIIIDYATGESRLADGDSLEEVQETVVVAVTEGQTEARTDAQSQPAAQTPGETVQTQPAAQTPSEATQTQPAAQSPSEAAQTTAQSHAGAAGYAVNGNNGKIHINGACQATGSGKNAMKNPQYFSSYEEAENYSKSIAPSLADRKCGNCWK